MRNNKVFLIILFLFTTSFLCAQNTSDTTLQTTKETKQKQLSKHKNMVSFGLGTGVARYNKTPALIYNASYQRDIIRRLSLELHFEQYRTNTFPDFATPEGSYSHSPILEVKKFINEKIKEGYMDWEWMRTQTTSLVVNVLFHMVENVHHRFSVYAGLGYVNLNGLAYGISSYQTDVTTGAVIGYHDDTRQYNANYWLWDCGLRYAYTFADRFSLGLDVGYHHTPYFLKMVESDIYCKANLYFGIRF